MDVRRILHLRTVTGKGGGPEKTLLATPKHLGPDYEVRLAYLRPRHDPEYDMPARARACHVPLIDIPEWGPADPRSLFRLAAEIRRFRPHLLHAHDYKTNVLSLLLGRWFNIPVMTTLHGYVTLGGRLNLYYRIDRWALRRMDHLVAVSSDLYDFLGQLGIPAARRSLVENGIDIELYRRSLDPRECKGRFGFDRDRFLVGAVGRLQPEKGFDLLIESAALLLDQGLDFNLAIAGDGPDRAKLDALIRRHGCGDRIRLLGHCSQTKELFQAMDVFVLSSLREGLPNVLLEAMALEVPVVATAVGGVPRLVQHEVNGLRIPSGDPEALAASVRALLGDSALRTRLAAAGRKTIEEHFSFAQRIQQTCRIYDHVLGVDVRRVLHLRTITGKGGGPEKTLLSTPRHLGSEYEVRIACLRPRRDPEYNMPERAREFGVSLLDIPETGPVDPRTIFRLAAEVRQFRPHVLHAHDYKTDVLGVLLGRWFGIPTVTTLHGFGFLSGRLGFYHRLDRWALRRMHHSIAVSPDLYEFLGALGIPDGRRSLVENAIDTEVYRRWMDRGECKRLFGFDPETLLVGAVGRLQPEKGFDLLIESASKLLEQGLTFNLVIAGDGPERDRLEAVIQARGRTDRIRLLGHCSQTINLYHAIDVFVSSSLREGLPNVLLEAMALEVPVAATQVGGVPRLVRHEDNGLLVVPGDQQALTGAMARLLGDPPLRLRLGAAGRKTIQERYSFAQRMQEVRDVYDRVLAETGDGVRRQESGGKGGTGAER